MSLLPDLRVRSREEEILDGALPEEETRLSLADLRFANRWLGNRRSLRRAMRPYLEGGGRVLDVGCGSGDVLCFLVPRLPPPLIAVGVDLKPLHLREAPCSILRVAGDALRLPFPDRCFDVVISSLFLHHFDAERLPVLLGSLFRVARRALVVSDLHRALVPFLFGRAFFPLLFRSRVSVEDGLLSFRRALNPAELREAFARAGVGPVRVARRFPYRLVALAERGPSPSGAEP
jgi:SAM-dependent methyltransferase